MLCHCEELFTRINGFIISRWRMLYYCLALLKNVCWRLRTSNVNWQSQMSKPISWNSAWSNKHNRTGPKLENVSTATKIKGKLSLHFKQGIIEFFIYFQFQFQLINFIYNFECWNYYFLFIIYSSDSNLWFYFLNVINSVLFECYN